MKCRKEASAIESKLRTLDADTPGAEEINELTADLLTDTGRAYRTASDKLKKEPLTCLATSCQVSHGVAREVCSVTAEVLGPVCHIASRDRTGLTGQRDGGDLSTLGLRHGWVSRIAPAAAERGCHLHNCRTTTSSMRQDVFYDEEHAAAAHQPSHQKYRTRPFGWRREAWQAALHDDELTLSMLDRLDENIDREITRTVVLEELSAGRVTPAFVAAMIWGYGKTGYGPARALGTHWSAWTCLGNRADSVRRSREVGCWNEGCSRFGSG